MSKKQFNNFKGIVYSTDPGFNQAVESREIITVDPGNQLLKVILDKKQRAGKSVTLVTCFEGDVIQLEELGKKLKTFCGTGGSVKDGQILIQGDNRDKIINWLQKKDGITTIIIVNAILYFFNQLCIV